MANYCELTGKKPETGNLVSHSNIKTRTRWLPNTQRKQYFIAELGETLTLRLSTRAIRTIDKHGGIVQAIRKASEENLSARLQKIRKGLMKKGVTASLKKENPSSPPDKKI